MAINKGADMSLVVEEPSVADAIPLAVQVVQGQVYHIHPETQKPDASLCCYRKG